MNVLAVMATDIFQSSKFEGDKKKLQDVVVERRQMETSSQLQLFKSTWEAVWIIVSSFLHTSPGASITNCE